MPIRPEVERALAQDVLIDLVTVGRKSGQRRYTECRFMWRSGKVYVSGFPGRRDWLANARANPEVFIHVKQSAHALLRGRAWAITNLKEKRPLCAQYMGFWTPTNPIEKLLRFMVVNSTQAWVRWRLPMWGPFWPIDRIIRKMPLLEVTLLEEVPHRD